MCVEWMRICGEMSDMEYMEWMRVCGEMSDMDVYGVDANMWGNE